MSPDGYTIEITNLSPNATKKEIYEFFAFCGAIQRVEIIRTGEYACKAKVTFKNPHAVETAVILNGSTILDQPVCITKCRHYEVIDNLPNPWHNSERQKVSPPAGKAVTLAQDMVKTMAAKGKDALGKAKAFDESHHVSAKVAELSEGVGLTNKITTGVEAAKSIDQKYGISCTTKSAVAASRRTASSAANAVVSSSYFSKGAFWLSGALNRASQVAADLSSRGVRK
ncbi:protein vip1 [Phtheirospermum japonicum]|uniref:Protein vip1 n=1 Tax=Phtheirospermum japonicum TaxID=374723 RepID=A0A830DRJ6_9LAMI|nr:protein vip1 [Phtheirospermum japonicum]